jgi:hypothetical protein
MYRKSHKGNIRADPKVKKKNRRARGKCVALLSVSMPLETPLKNVSISRLKVPFRAWSGLVGD